MHILLLLFLEVNRTLVAPLAPRLRTDPDPDWLSVRYLDYDEPALQQLNTSSLTDKPAIAGIESSTPITTPSFGGITPAAEEGAGILLVGEQQQQEVNRGRPSTRLGRVVAGWVSLLPDAARSWGRLEQFLELIEGIGNMGDRERDLLLNRRMVCRLSSFFLQVRLLL